MYDLHTERVTKRKERNQVNAADKAAHACMQSACVAERAKYCKSSARVQGDICLPVTGAEGAHAARVHLSSRVQCQVSYLAITCVLSWSRTLF